MAFWPDLSTRSHEPELIDDEASLVPAEVRRMHDELAVINRWLGGLSASMRTIVAHTEHLPALTCLDVGSGGADVPRALVRWGRARGLPVRIVALDVSRRACAELARRTEGYPEITPLVADGRRIPLPDRSVDVAHAALLFHHLDDRDGVRLLGDMRRVSRLGVVVNDLHRHLLAWGSIGVLTRLFSRSRLIRHDAPLSVRRGFTRRELAALVTASGGRADLRWRWAFRWVGWIDA